MDNRRATITVALIALICFFLPWIQVSCGANRETASGIDLAKDGNAELWLIPVLMLAVVFVALKLWKERGELSSVVGLISGLVSAYLMNRERLRFEDSDGFIRVGVTGWFWLGLGSSVAMVVLAAVRLLRVRKVMNDA
jgi:hypothetical protein